MKISDLKERPNLSDNIKLSRIYLQLKALLEELRKKELPAQIIESINRDIEELNATTVTGNDLTKLVKQKQTKILKSVEKELRITPKNYYRSLWLPLGMSLGMVIGVAFGVSIGNLGMMGVGLPIGLGIGIAIGSAMDKKAFTEGRQLEIEIKY